MTWVKLDDQFADHPKVENAGPEAAWLYVAGLCYCARYLTDGSIPKARVARLTALKTPEKWARRLEEVGLWFDAGDVYLVHDYLDYQPSREEAEAHKREVSRKRSEAGRRGAAARWHGKDGKRDGNDDGSVPDLLLSDVDGKPMAPSPSPSPYEEVGTVDENDSVHAIPGDPVISMLDEARQKLRGAS